jgi:hypothetical protein
MRVVAQRCPEVGRRGAHQQNSFPNCVPLDLPSAIVTTSYPHVQTGQGNITASEFAADLRWSPGEGGDDYVTRSSSCAVSTTEGLCELLDRAVRRVGGMVTPAVRGGPEPTAPRWWCRRRDGVDHLRRLEPHAGRPGAGWARCGGPSICVISGRRPSCWGSRSMR